MPTMHRISCFRDDIVFIIYLYQVGDLQTYGAYRERTLLYF
jgi:hypothetical protein